VLGRTRRWRQISKIPQSGHQQVMLVVVRQRPALLCRTAAEVNAGAGDRLP
jgi:hypothetical protein